MRLVGKQFQHQELARGVTGQLLRFQNIALRMPSVATLLINVFLLFFESVIAFIPGEPPDLLLASGSRLLATDPLPVHARFVSTR